MFGLSPVASVGVDQLPEFRAVVVMLEVREFMDQHIVDASTGGFDEMGVQDDFTC